MSSMITSPRGASNPSVSSPSTSGCRFEPSWKRRSKGACGGSASCQLPPRTRTFASSRKSSAAARARAASSSAVKNGTDGSSAETIHAAPTPAPVPVSATRCRPRAPASTCRRRPVSGEQDRSKPSAAASSRARLTSGGNSCKLVDDGVDRREDDAPFAPERGAGGDPLLVQPARRILDEAHAPSALEKAADRRVVAHIGRYPEHDDLVRVERVE